MKSKQLSFHLELLIPIKLYEGAMASTLQGLY